MTIKAAVLTTSLMLAPALMPGSAPARDVRDQLF